MSQHRHTDKVNKMCALKNRSHGGFIAYSRFLLYCIVLGLFVTFLLVYLFIVIQKFSF